MGQYVTACTAMLWVRPHSDETRLQATAAYGCLAGRLPAIRMQRPPRSRRPAPPRRTQCVSARFGGAGDAEGPMPGANAPLAGR